MRLRREAFWVLVLVVIGLDLWWSTTPLTFEVWWIPLIVLNLACLGVVLYPVVFAKD